MVTRHCLCALLFFHSVCSHFDVWLYFVLKYVKCKKLGLRVFLGLYGAIAVAQTVLVIYNIFDHVMFSVVNGEYVRGPVRFMAFISLFGVSHSDAMYAGSDIPRRLQI